MFTRNLSWKNAWGLHNGGFQKKHSTSLDNSNRCARIELPLLFLQHVSLLNGSDIISLPSICHSKLHRLLKQNIGLFCWGIQKSVIFRCKSYFLHKYDRYTRHFIDFRHNILTSLPYPSKPWKILQYFTEYWYYSGQQIWKKNTCHFSISPQEISTGKRNMNRVKYRTVGHFIGLAIGQWTNRMTLNTI